MDPVQPGTIFVSSGRGAVPDVVRWATCSKYTHGSISCKITRWNLSLSRPCRQFRWDEPRLRTWQPGVYLVESTTLSPEPCLVCGRRLSGVQVHEINRTVDAYDGRVWVMELRNQLRLDESVRLTEVLLDLVGTEYDAVGAGLAGTKVLKRFCPWAHRQQGPYYCIELIGRALNYAFQGRVLPEIQPGELSPADLVRLMVRSGLYYKPRRLK